VCERYKLELLEMQLRFNLLYNKGGSRSLLPRSVPEFITGHRVGTNNLALRARYPGCLEGAI